MATPSPYYKLYQKSSIGSALVDTIDDLISDARITPQLANRILENFDRIITEVLENKVNWNMTFKGRLDTYRFCDEVWTFLLKDVVFKFPPGTGGCVKTDKIQIVSCNSKRPGEGA